MSKQRKQKRRRQIQARYGSVSSVPFEKDSFHQEDVLVPSVPFKKDSLPQEDAQSRGVELLSNSMVNLPEVLHGSNSPQDEPNCVGYAITKLPCIVPHLETLAVSSTCERVNTPIVSDKFLHLKHLNIYLGGDDDGAISRTYDYLSLASFLDSSPVLESFILSVDQFDMKHDSIFGDDTSHMRQIPGYKHDRLKTVQINGFCSAKSMVELTCYILENAASLESLTLDTIFCGVTFGNYVRCCALKTGKCVSKGRNMVLEAHKALNVIKRCILGKVPSAVKLNVGEPCRMCHSVL
ncbi:hypothetical protein PR202_gb09433 [Eleusine coracana subsp. coracana]|uniref:At1g61320/AtMIF1 LRR domain-containing protein n=1 Tax=Eleusine coracana subsp. coracana TaxID=191504 RepID=A0AAV5EHZ4_ELECO|nr:hypothetical protein PR202_gb09433 [Eleusine coracana subsp. coracana]